MNSTYLSEDIQKKTIELYWFGDGVPLINYFFLLLIFFYYFTKIFYLVHHKKSITKHIRIGTCSEIKIVCIISVVINIIANIVSILIYPVIDEQACLFIIVYGNYIVQICDNSIFYFGYKALHKNTITRKFTLLFVVYTIIFMSLSWLPIYIIIPYIDIDETNVFIQIYVNNGTNIYTYSNILFNLFFTIEFTKIVYYFRNNKKHISQTTYIIAVKCITHCFTSNFGILLLNYYNVNSIETSVIYIFILSTSMNIIFNFSVVQKLESLYMTTMSIKQSIQSINIIESIQSLQSINVIESTKSLQSSQTNNVYDDIDDDIDVNIDKKILQKTPFTPLNIYNGTPEGVLSDVPRATLPINQLKSTDIKDVRSNSNVHRCNIDNIIEMSSERYGDNDFYVIPISENT